MARAINISLKKHAKQDRSLATVAALLEAATYIFSKHGPKGFTANKVAEKAGVNIASFYQYFPNKQALLFHLVKLQWDRQLARLAPLLTRQSGASAQRLRDFIREFFMIEAAEADLRRALKTAAVDLHDTQEFKALLTTGADLLRGFFADAVGSRPPDELAFEVDFVVLLVTSFAERTTDEKTAGAVLIRQADMLSDLLIARFGIR